VQVAGSRYYNPGLGRWTSRDPLTEVGHVAVRRPVRRLGESMGYLLLGFAEHSEIANLSLFCINNAASLHDPSGLAVPSPNPCRPCRPGDLYGRRHDPSLDPAAHTNGCTAPHLLVLGGDSPNLLVPSCSFKPACDDHDICYGTCHAGHSQLASWAGCNAGLLAGAMAQCNACAHSHFPHWWQLPYRVAYKADCYVWATAYYAAVQSAGVAWYVAGQAKACVKCDCPCIVP
jgi:hypothetical protein